MAVGGRSSQKRDESPLASAASLGGLAGGRGGGAGGGGQVSMLHVAWQGTTLGRALRHCLKMASNELVILPCPPPGAKALSASPLVRFRKGGCIRRARSSRRLQTRASLPDPSWANQRKEQGGRKAPKSRRVAFLSGNGVSRRPLTLQGQGRPPLVEHCRGSVLLFSRSRNRTSAVRLGCGRDDKARGDTC